MMNAIKKLFQALARFFSRLAADEKQGADTSESVAAFDQQLTQAEIDVKKQKNVLDDLHTAVEHAKTALEDSTDKQHELDEKRQKVAVLERSYNSGLSKYRSILSNINALRQVIDMSKQTEGAKPLVDPEVLEQQARNLHIQMAELNEVMEAQAITDELSKMSTQAQRERYGDTDENDSAAGYGESEKAVSEKREKDGPEFKDLEV